ncbi:hypothetical protein DH2020_045283 [Rehmannia glutinosa]|uniref:Cyclin-dependent kinase inhibitor domain-containing protein n=1 Tax=Rehmannia glutinosa TaxID=99300 RepID=A0ABR0UEI8_REHGL
MQMNFSKKRKLYCEHENEYCSNVELPENAVSPAAHQVVESTEVGRKSLRSSDLENVDRQSEGLETEISASINGFCSKEATPTSELCGDHSEQFALMDSSSASTQKLVSPPPASPNRKISASAPKTPPAAELEEFFAEAEKYVQKRFAEKYNYDIVKDVPLEGRYQWVRLHP